MNLPTLISCQPSFNFSHRLFNHKSLKPSLFLELPASKLVFTRAFMSKKAIFERKKVMDSYSMAGLTRISSFRSRNGDQGVEIIEQETLVDGSSEFRPHVVGLEHEAILNKLSKWFVAALFGAIILLRHDGEALWAAMGSVINAILSLILKRIFDQERPIPTSKSDPGMPSSHAQSVFFIAVFSVLSIFEWLGVNTVSVIVSAITLAFGSYLSYLRVSQRLHTVSQVVVGACVGSIFSIVWLWLWKAIVMEEFVSSLVVQLIVLSGAFVFCFSFVIYVIQNWFENERTL